MQISPLHLHVWLVWFFFFSRRNPLKWWIFLPFFAIFIPKEQYQLEESVCKWAAHLHILMFFPTIHQANIFPLFRCRTERVGTRKKYFYFQSYKTCQLIMNNKTREDLLLTSSEFRGKKSEIFWKNLRLPGIVFT